MSEAVESVWNLFITDGADEEELIGVKKPIRPNEFVSCERPIGWYVVC